LVKNAVKSTGAIIVVLLLAAIGAYYFFQHQAALEEKSRAEASLSTLRGEMTTLRDKNAILSRQNEDLQQALSDQQDRLLSAEDRSRALSEAQKKLKAEVESTLAAVAQERAEFDEKLNQARKQLAQQDRSLEEKLREKIASKDIIISRLKNQLKVDVADKILFELGSYELRDEGKKVLKELALALDQSPDQMIRVEGHTDDLPMSGRSARVPTNWELSSLRALAAVRYLNEICGLPGERLAAAGYGQYRPLVPNDSEENRARNRRIEIILTPVGAP
jgi:chemotaxis protein MotB